jgi:creatinine amidohydrolase
VTDRKSHVVLAEMTSAQVRAELGRGRSTVVVPFGAVEPTSHLTPTLSSRIAWDLCSHSGSTACARRRYGSAALSTISPSRGTLSLRPQTLEMIVVDLVDSLVRHGFRRVVLLATHGG